MILPPTGQLASPVGTVVSPRPIELTRKPVPGRPFKLDARTFRRASRRPGGIASHLGRNRLFLFEFDVAKVGEHSHLLHVPSPPNTPQIITAFPEAGFLRVAGPTPWAAHGHSPLRDSKSAQRRVVLVDAFADEDWKRVVNSAQTIDGAHLNYNFVSQNSNSVAAALLATLGLPFLDLPGGGLNPGAKNLLFDEIAGGSQQGKLLARDRVLYLGGLRSPLPGSPQGLDTDA